MFPIKRRSNCLASKLVKQVEGINEKKGNEHEVFQMLGLLNSHKCLGMSKTSFQKDENPGIIVLVEWQNHHLMSHRY
jgi:hypothetical protein